MDLRDRIDLAIAGGTFLLALATFVLARYARQTARDNRDAVTAFKQQAAASERHAATAEQALANQRDLSRRQLRAVVVWAGSEMPKTRISDNPRSWSIGAANGTALVIEGRIRNLSPIAAYIGTADYNAPIIEVIPGESHLPGGAETAVDVFVASTGGEISLMSEPIGLRYSSMASGEEAIAVAHVHGAGTIAGQSSGGTSPYELAFKGWTAITTGDEAPEAKAETARS